MTFALIEIVERKVRLANRESKSMEEISSTHKRHSDHRRAQDYDTSVDSLVDPHEKNRRTCEKDLPGLRPVNDYLIDGPDYIT